MNVTVHRHGTRNFIVVLHASNGHGYIVDHAETFSMVREGVMKPTADVEPDTMIQREISRQD
jgi:hypothetical protein